MFIFFIFAGIPAKPAPGTRTKFTYFFEDLTDADPATQLIDWRWENIHVTAEPGTATVSARCSASSA